MIGMLETENEIITETKWRKPKSAPPRDPVAGMYLDEARVFLRQEAPECQFRCMLRVATGPDKETWCWLGSGPASPDKMLVCEVDPPVTKQKLRVAIRKLR